jgi:hypothetical protein
MQKNNENLGYSYTVPDRPTNRQQLAYFSNSLLARGADTLERYWLAAAALIQDWQCEVLPDIHTDLNSISSPKATLIMIEVGLDIKRYMDALEEIPKN